MNVKIPYFYSYLFFARILLKSHQILNEQREMFNVEKRRMKENSIARRDDDDDYGDFHLQFYTALHNFI